MLSLLSWTTLLTILAFLTIAWEASRRPRQPIVALFGIALLIVALVVRFTEAPGGAERLMGLLLNVGAGLLAAALLMRLRKASARPFLLIGLFVLLLLGIAWIGFRAFPSAPAAPPAATTTLLLELGPDDVIDEVEPALDAAGARAERAFPAVSLDEDADLAQVYVLHVSPEAADLLAARLRADTENVDHLEANLTIDLDPVPAVSADAAASRTPVANDVMVGDQWALDAIRGHEAHALLADLVPIEQALIAIIDTGVDAGHEDLAAAWQASPGGADLHGHGTHCAGLAGAVTNNELGMASLNWEGQFVRVASFPALNDRGNGDLVTLARAIIAAADAGADVLSMSLGEHTPLTPKVLRDAVGYALRERAIVVAAAGNSSRDARSHIPSNIDGVISVAALQPDLRKAPFSNTNQSLSRPLSAPGVGILSLQPKNTYRPLNGTSMATPIVSGLLGVLRALDPDLSADDAYALLRDTGADTPDAPRVGPLINAEAAIQTVLERTPDVIVKESVARRD